MCFDVNVCLYMVGILITYYGAVPIPADLAVLMLSIIHIHRSIFMLNTNHSDKSSTDLSKEIIELEEIIAFGAGSCMDASCSCTVNKDGPSCTASVSGSCC